MPTSGGEGTWQRRRVRRYGLRPGDSAVGRAGRLGVHPGVGGLGFAGTASNETVAAPAGLTTLADDEFQCGPRMPMLPGAWDLGTWDRGD